MVSFILILLSFLPLLPFALPTLPSFPPPFLSLFSAFFSFLKSMNHCIAWSRMPLPPVSCHWSREVWSKHCFRILWTMSRGCFHFVLFVLWARVGLGYLCSSWWFWSSISCNSLVLVEAGHGDIGFFLTWSQGSEDGLPLGSRVQCQGSGLEWKQRGQGAVCSSRAKQQVSVQERPILATFLAIWGPGEGEPRGITHTDVPSQAPEWRLSSESFWADAYMLGGPVGALHTCSEPLLLRLL